MPTQSSDTANQIALYKVKSNALLQQNKAHKPFLILHAIVATAVALFMIALIAYKGFKCKEASLGELGALFVPSGGLAFFVTQIISAYSKVSRTSD